MLVKPANVLQLHRSSIKIHLLDQLDENGVANTRIASSSAVDCCQFAGSNQLTHHRTQFTVIDAVSNIAQSMATSTTTPNTPTKSTIEKGYSPTSSIFSTMEGNLLQNCGQISICYHILGNFLWLMIALQHHQLSIKLAHCVLVWRLVSSIYVCICECIFACASILCFCNDCTLSRPQSFLINTIVIVVNWQQITR